MWLECLKHLMQLNVCIFINNKSWFRYTYGFFQKYTNAPACEYKTADNQTTYAKTHLLTLHIAAVCEAFFSVSKLMTLELCLWWAWTLSMTQPLVLGTNYTQMCFATGKCVLYRVKYNIMWKDKKWIAVCHIMYPSLWHWKARKTLFLKEWSHD